MIHLRKRNKMRNLSVFFKFMNSQSVYTTDAISVKGGSGIYKESEWGLTREKSLGFYSNPTLQNYFRLIFRDQGKISSASILCENFDFSDFNKVGDIGGVPFSQAWAIRTIFPNLKFVLSDYDNGSLAKFKACSPFEPKFCNFASFDAIADDFSIFDGCDLLTMWGVDYALQDVELLRLIKLVKSQEKTLLMATLDIDSKSYVKRVISQLHGTLLQAVGRARYHGLLRKQSYIIELCKLAGVNCKCIVADNNYRVFRVN